MLLAKVACVLSLFLYCTGFFSPALRYRRSLQGLFQQWSVLSTVSLVGWSGDLHIVDLGRKALG